MKRRSNTKQPHDPYVLFLDEGVSGTVFVSLLTQARLTVQPYEKLLRKNSKTSDAKVIEAAAGANFVLVTKDQRMESDWTEDIITQKAKIILLTDDDGGPVNWMAALLVGHPAWTRVLLDHPAEPVTMRISKSGTVTKVAGEQELRRRRDQLLTSRIVREKRQGISERRRIVKKADLKTDRRDSGGSI